MRNHSPSSSHESDAFLAAIITSSHDAIISTDTRGLITSWNPSAERLYGYPASEVIGRPISILYPPGREADAAESLRRALAGGSFQEQETLRRQQSGALVPVALTISPIRDAEGTIIGVSKMARDLRQQKRAEERFLVTLASIGDAVISTDLEGRVVFMNAVAEQLTGWPQGEAIGQPLENVFRIVNEFTRVTVDSPVRRVLREGNIVGLANHTVLVARNGREWPIDDSAAPIRSTDGELHGVVLIFRDVTARHEAEIQSQRLAAIVEGSDDAIIGKDLNSVVTFWNPAAERIFGYTAAEMEGQSITRIIPPERLDEERLILTRIRAGERVEHFETIRLRKDGRTFHASLTISPIRDREGTIVGASQIARDITAQKEAEFALRAAQAKLQSHAQELERIVAERTARLREMVGELESFSYSLSHDMRAPLRAIQGFSEIVLTEYGDQIPEGVDYLRRVVNAASRMDRLIQDVLAFARVSRQEIRLERVEIERLVREIIEERPGLQPPNAEVAVVTPMAPVKGDDASLVQCMANLLENAVKFVQPGTVPHVRVFTTAEDGRVRVSVQDNGIGIPPENQSRLFSVFTRLSGAQGYEGTGLGLAIVRKAAERMGGTVGVTSSPGAGSTFWVELPRADA
ncbi:PAS domain-containing sensor histidine kinase [Opitutus sp. ER46]|uniref:sensor histidine kinase n=1 Tax=Opitutus sp. ER46 TaxID=2161864 RepID=UPI0013048105|nr:PAS domain-containing sensor histidine kinase [Opitutus sp. ER46]